MMISTKKKYANAIQSKHEAALQEIHSKPKNIAIYQRDIQPLKTELAQIAAQVIECRTSGTVEEVLSDLKNYFDHHLTNCPGLLTDVGEVLELFRKITQASSFRLQLMTVNTDMCRKFHTDINVLRLLCTYIGPGTLWVPDEIVNYKALLRRGENQEIVSNEQEIQQVPTGDVVILKGGLYTDANPILHRSPTIEENGDKRLLLRIDTNEFLDFLT
ncbi:MAG: DUF1826 domain-containing protein [Bacteroidota bacterium]